MRKKAIRYTTGEIGKVGPVLRDFLPPDKFALSESSTGKKGGASVLGSNELISRRRMFRIDGYKTFAEVGFDGEWVSPYQTTSNSTTGPVFVALHWLDEPSIAAHHSILSKLGYLPELRFNNVLDIALTERKLDRSKIYVTQAFQLVPQKRSQQIPFAALNASFEAITRHELVNRKVLALGNDAARACAHFGIPHIAVPHPSRRGYSNVANVSEISRALIALGY